MTVPEEASGGGPHRRAVWWLALLRPWTLMPFGNFRGRSMRVQRWPRGMGAVVPANRDNFVVKLLLESGDRRLRRFDWGGFAPFLALAAAEGLVGAILGIAAMLWMVASLSVTSFLVGALGCWVAGRHLRSLEERGTLEELRALPMPDFVLETGLLVTPCAVGVAGALAVNVAFLTLMIGGMLRSMGPGGLLIAILPMVWGGLRVAVVHAALRYGLYLGWRRGVEAFRSGEQIPSGLMVWTGEQLLRALVWLVVLSLTGAVVASGRGGLLVLPASIAFLFCAFPVPVNYWLTRGGIADTAVEQMAAGRSIVDVLPLDAEKAPEP